MCVKTKAITRCLWNHVPLYCHWDNGGLVELKSEDERLSSTYKNVLGQPFVSYSGDEHQEQGGGDDAEQGAYEDR